MADEKKKPEEETPQDEKKSETPAEEKLIYAKEKARKRRNTAICELKKYGRGDRI